MISEANNYHIPVMLNEVLEYLGVKPGEWYVDCNLGGGGHTAGILKKGGKVIGIDLDPDAISHVAKKYGLELSASGPDSLTAYSDRLILMQGNFADLAKILKQVRQSLFLQSKGQEDIPSTNKIAGVLYDLGVSSYQLETPSRGFSFNQNAPLDMRMDPLKPTATAADLINGLHEKELAELFWKLGEENFAKPIAKAIVEKRKEGKIETTNQLAQIILTGRKRSEKDRTHPATRVFQALRIAVNDELNSLKESLPQAFEILGPGGRMAVISFHSLEDRIVKEFIRGKEDRGEGRAVNKKPIEPTENEIYENPRARSGKLRVLEKIE